MTVLATTVRRSSASHAFVVPVVRELGPRPVQFAAGSAW
jgi:hypothetical protein